MIIISLLGGKKQEKKKALGFGPYLLHFLSLLKQTGRSSYLQCFVLLINERSSGL